MIYFNNVKRGFEQDRVKQLAEAVLDSIAFPATITLQLGGMLTDRCIAVTNAQLVELQTALYNHFIELGYDLRPLFALHIDLRGGASDAALEPIVDTRRWNY